MAELVGVTIYSLINQVSKNEVFASRESTKSAHDFGAPHGALKKRTHYEEYSLNYLLRRLRITANRESGVNAAESLCTLR